MKLRLVSDDSRSAIVHALRVAAEKYTENARVCRGLGHSGDSVADMFLEQAVQATHWADVIDNAEEIRLSEGVG